MERIFELDESALVLHGVRFPREPRRYYQRKRAKHSSGSAEWHSRSERLRDLQRVIAAHNPGGLEGLLVLARRIAVVLS